jgi:hypothetical protein
MNNAIRNPRYYDAGTWAVGEIVHLGMFNGQVSRKYRVTGRVDASHVSLVSVVSVSARNDDGTFSSRYAEET